MILFSSLEIYLIVRIVRCVFEVFLKEQFMRLEKEQIFVYISHGNHDPLTEKITNDWPDNVSVFSNRVETYQAITKDGETIFVHGFSYQHDTSYENKIDEYPSSQGKKVFILECYTVLIVNLQLKIAILNLF